MPKPLPKRFTDQAAARRHLEGLLWPEGPVCPHCGVVNEATALTGKSTRPGVYWCNACQAPFSVTVGTVFERSKIPLHTWLYANHLLLGASKKGMSSHQLARMLGVTVKTAWFMSHRLREATTPIVGSEPPLGGDGFVVEADETEIAPSRKTRPRPRAKNMKFVSLVERDGRVRSRKLTGAKMNIKAEISTMLYDHMDPETTLHTDGAQHYKFLLDLARHESVDHDKAYARDGKSGRVHTNTAEGYFSIFKRGLVGTYQHMSEQHLHRYLAEFDFRATNRVAQGVDDNLRTERAIKGAAGKRLMYRNPDEPRETRLS